MPDNRPILTGKKVTLEPLEAQDMDYVIELADTPRNGHIGRREAVKTLDRYSGKFWAVQHEGTRAGVIGYFQQGNRYLMEALKDPKTSPIGLKASMESAELMIQHMFGFTDKIRVCAKVGEPGLMKMFRKLGFFFFNNIGDIIIYQREK